MDAGSKDNEALLLATIVALGEGLLTDLAAGEEHEHWSVAWAHETAPHPRAIPCDLEVGRCRSANQVRAGRDPSGTPDGRYAGGDVPIMDEGGDGRGCRPRSCRTFGMPGRRGRQPDEPHSAGVRAAGATTTRLPTASTHPPVPRMLSRNTHGPAPASRGRRRTWAPLEMSAGRVHSSWRGRCRCRPAVVRAEVDEEDAHTQAGLPCARATELVCQDEDRDGHRPTSPSWIMWKPLNRWRRPSRLGRCGPGFGSRTVNPASTSGGARRSSAPRRGRGAARSCRALFLAGLCVAHFRSFPRAVGLPGAPSRKSTTLSLVLERGLRRCRRCGPTPGPSRSTSVHLRPRRTPVVGCSRRRYPGSA